MTNLADYHTKHHPTNHQRNVRLIYVLNSVATFPSKRHCKGVLKPPHRYKPLHVKNRWKVHSNQSRNKSSSTHT